MSSPGDPEAVAARRAWLRGLASLIAAGSALGLAAAVVLHHFRAGDEARKKAPALRERVEMLADRIRSREPGRPIFRGTPAPGNAWDDYLPALEAAGRLEVHYRLLDWIRFRKGTHDALKVSLLLEAHPEMIRHWRSGVRRERARLEPPSRLPHLGILGWFVQAHAWNLHLTGESREAAALLVEFIAWTRDLLEAGLHDDVLGTGPNEVNHALDLLRLMAESAVAGDGTLEDIDEGLEFIDLIYPGPLHRIEEEALARAIEHLNSAEFRGTDDWEWEAWRFGFSRPLMQLDGLEEVLDSLTRLQEIDSWSWSEEIRRFQELRARISEAYERSGRTFSDSYALRLRHAQIRLLRVAVRFRRTGEVLELADPFGDTLRVRTADGVLTAWSIGGDAKDDLGAGGFFQSGARRDDPWGPDIVLEATR